MSSETELSSSSAKHSSVRFDRLRVVLRLAVEQTVKRLMEPEQINACFSQLAAMEGGQAALEIARKQVANYFVNTSLSQFDHICQERNVKLRLDELDEIIQTAQDRRASGVAEQLHVDKFSAEQLVDMAVGQSKEDAIEKLLLIYDQLCADNESLYKELQESAQKCASLKDSVMSLVDSLQSGIDEIKRINFEELLEKLAEEVFGE